MFALQYKPAEYVYRKEYQSKPIHEPPFRYTMNSCDDNTYYDNRTDGCISKQMAYTTTGSGAID